MDSAHELERGPVGNRVHEDIAIDTNGEALADERELILPGGVDDVAQVLLSVMLDRAGEGVLDGGEVLLVEVVVDELDDERRLA